MLSTGEIFHGSGIQPPIYHGRGPDSISRSFPLVFVLDKMQLVEFLSEGFDPQDKFKKKTVSDFAYLNNATQDREE